MIENLEELAKNIGNLQYDLTAAIIERLADRVTIIATIKNSKEINDIANSLYEAKFSMDSAWSKCKSKMDGECVKHPRSIPNYTGTINELIEDLTRYPDRCKEFINYLGKDILRQAEADMKRGRPKLASHLYQASNYLFEAEMSI